MADSSSTRKWLGGITAGIIVGVATWWVTSSKYSPLTNDPDPISNTHDTLVHINPDRRARMIIFRFDFMANPVSVNTKDTAVFVVRNDGEAAATECNISWQIPKTGDSVVSNFFSLASGDSTVIQLSQYFRKVGKIDTKAVLRCRDASPDSVPRVLTVRNRYTGPRIRDIFKRKVAAPVSGKAN